MIERETQNMIEHLSVPVHTFVVDLIKTAIDDVNCRPDYWNAFEWFATRALASHLKRHVEGMFEDFYFAPTPQGRLATARMVADVGSLWRVDWQIVAEELFDEHGIDLEPPTDASFEV